MNTSNRAHIALPQVLEDTAGLAKIADLPRTGLDSVLRVAAQNIGLKEVHARLAVAVAASRECCTPGVDTGARAQVYAGKCLMPPSGVPEDFKEDDVIRFEDPQARLMHVCLSGPPRARGPAPAVRLGIQFLHNSRGAPEPGGRVQHPSRGARKRTGPSVHTHIRVRARRRAATSPCGSSLCSGTQRTKIQRALSSTESSRATTSGDAASPTERDQP